MLVAHVDRTTFGSYSKLGIPKKYVYTIPTLINLYIFFNLNSITNLIMDASSTTNIVITFVLYTL